MFAAPPRGDSRKPRPSPRFSHLLLALGGRDVPVVFAQYSPASGTRPVIGDSPDTIITVSRDVAGTLLVSANGSGRPT